MSEKTISRKITVELNRLQASLKISLQRFYNQKIKGSELPPETIKQKYGKEVEDLIGKTVQDSWLFSNSIMQEQTKQQIRITSKDGAGIEQTTTKMVDQFWDTSGKLWLRENEFKVNTNSQLVQLSEFDVPAAMVGMSILMTYYAFNQGIFSKRDEIDAPIKLKFVNREGCIDTAICIPLNGRIFGPGDIPIIPIQDTHKHCRCRLIPILA